ncbi:hypothetical protein [Blastococcus sp. URHD0036]|uniref:hypothetical protein n=1 Tax=Blastococcus sp. URHD0036 TaxID=1380356 RepID=UPI0004964C43|nr:hypothetical protein [Blastococcus sp. URHD0036]
MAGRPEDERAAAVAAAVEPYGWRGLTAVMLARLVVGAADRHAVLTFVAGLPEAAVGQPHAVEAADRGDPRVTPLVRLLEERRWRSWSLDRLAADLLAGLDAWLAGRLSAAGGTPDDR